MRPETLKSVLLWFSDILVAPLIGLLKNIENRREIRFYEFPIAKCADRNAGIAGLIWFAI